jgi:hypothetical protein
MLILSRHLLIAHIVETLMKIEIFRHLDENLPKFLNLQDDLRGNLVFKVAIFDGILINWVVFFGQKLEILLININVLVFFTQFFELLNPVKSELFVLFYK